MRRWLESSLALMLLVGCEATAAVSGPPPDVAGEDSDDVECLTACARPAPKEGPAPPTPAEFAKLVDAWLDQPMDAPSLPLETLLYHGEWSRRLMAGLSDEALPTERRTYLLSELGRSRASIELRLVAEDGELRGELNASGLELGLPSHQHLEGTGSLGDVELSGRVRRVGLHHLWSRW
ncbi:MAG: hypothetical protein VX498_06325 [Myxococcota bacterium]|nr:hypothetical protein [Myxococcota bacterium]